MGLIIVRIERLLILLVLLFAVVSCRQAPQDGAPEARALLQAGTAADLEEATLQLPELAPVEMGDGRALRVAATTSLIGDVVAQVGSEAVALTTLMSPGQDPHSYEPSTADLARVSEADVIFVNGWDLEETLVQDLVNVAGDTSLVPISANITPLLLGEEAAGEEGHEHRGVDPHVWLDPQLVMQWVQNVQIVLSSLDPDHAALYDANAAAYLQELQALDARMEAELQRIPAERRKLVTNHDALAYFARRFDFEIVGAVIPAASTLAEPSAQSMVALVAQMRAQGVCTIFTETTANARLAETVAAELDSCDAVQVLSLYTDALGEQGSGAESYVGMMELNLDAILRGLGNGD